MNLINYIKLLAEEDAKDGMGSNEFKTTKEKLKEDLVRIGVNCDNESFLNDCWNCYETEFEKIKSYY